MAETIKRLHNLLDYDRDTGVFTWKVTRLAGKQAGRINYKGYRQIGIDSKLYMAHRLAWLFIHGQWPSQIDHIDGIKDHNAISNLRLATNAQNRINAKAKNNSMTGLKGVSRNGNGWQARIGNRGNKSLGTFKTPEEAHAAYIKAAKELFGEFANPGYVPSADE